MKVLTKREFKKMVKVDEETGCWNWAGSISNSGYGYLSYDGDHTFAHRLAICLFTKKSIKNVFVCHRCDNRKCTNPKHLFIGNAKTNKLDSVQKKRHVFGIRQFTAKLSEKNILRIRSDYIPNDPKYNMYMLAKKYGVAPCTIYKVVKRISWKHI